MAGNVFGFKVVAHPLLPKDQSVFRLSGKVPLTEEARERHQKKLDEFFGRKPLFIMIDKSTIFTHPDNMKHFRKEP